MNQKSILIVEDEVLIAADIQAALSKMGYHVVAIAYDKEDALTALQKYKPNLALLDINLGNNMDGIEIAEIINQKYLIPFIFLTSYSGKQVIEKVKHTQPMGYILKPFTEKDLFSNIEIALFNFQNKVKKIELSHEFLNEKLTTPLTEKEFEILLDAYEGSTNNQLAEKHFLSLNTIKSHLKNIYIKTDCHSRAELIAKIHKLLQ